MDEITASLVKRSRTPVPQAGERFGRLRVTGEFGHVVSRIPRLTVLCECDCGSRKFMYAQYLRSGRARSCGCAVAESGRARKMPPGAKVIDSPLYSVWKSMRQRCSDPTTKAYPHYGGRGIKVCAEWQGDFRAFEGWALAAGYRPGLTLDRQNNGAGYSPDNCRWATPTEQARNTRRNRLMTAFGETKSVAEWALDHRCRVAAGTLYNRLAQGEGHERAIVTPSQTHLMAFGETKTLKEWARDPRCTVSYKVLWQRLNMNSAFTPESAISSEPWASRRR